MQITGLIRANNILIIKDKQAFFAKWPARKRRTKFRSIETQLNAR
jgi:hypothetical protein